MSDPARKDLSTKAKEVVTPEAMKSDTQKLKEGATDTTDRITREVHTDSSKSKTQDIMDKGERAKDNEKHGSTEETVGDKIKHAVGLDKKDSTTTS